MRTRIYVAGPYTKPDPEANTRAAVAVGHRLLDAAYAPFVPHLTHFMELQRSRPYEDWMRLDFAWVACCHALYRMPGESSGADREAALANQLKIPVYHNLDTLMAEVPAWTRGPETPDPPAAGHPAYLKLLDELRALHLKKAADYGTDADPLANLRASAGLGIAPWRAAVLRMGDKWTRLKTFCTKGTLANEGVEDTLQDLAAYALLTLVLYREEKDGSPQQ